MPTRSCSGLLARCTRPKYIPRGRRHARPILRPTSLCTPCSWHDTRYPSPTPVRIECLCFVSSQLLPPFVSLPPHSCLPICPTGCPRPCPVTASLPTLPFLGSIRKWALPTRRLDRAVARKAPTTDLTQTSSTASTTPASHSYPARLASTGPRAAPANGPSAGLCRWCFGVIGPNGFRCLLPRQPVRPFRPS